MGRNWAQQQEAREKKIQWLVDHYDLWNSWSVFDETTKKEQRRLVEGMRDAGLISKSTYWLDINLVRLIREARQKMNRERLLPKR